MIKKTLWLLILWLFSIWITNWYWLQVLYNWIEWEIRNLPLATYWNTFKLQNWANFLLNWQYKLFQTINEETAWWNNITYRRLRNIFWTENWLYVIVSTSPKNTTSWIQTNNIKQWYIHQFCKTTYWTEEVNICSDYWTNITVYSINDFIENEQYKNPDIILYKDSWQYYQFCFWYENLNENICFDLDSSDCNDYCNTNCSNSSIKPWMTKECNTINITRNPLMWELWTASDQITPIATYSVFWKTNEWWWEQEITKPITTHPCMTLNELFALRPQYNTWLCYSSDKIRNWTSFETTTQYSIYELYHTYNDFRNDLNLYQNYCWNYVATQTACQNAFNWKQAEYSLISKLPNNINDKDLYNYCDLALNYDRNTSTCVINSWATTPKPWTEPTYEDIIKAITNQNIKNQAPNTWTVFDELCEEWDENCLQNMAVNRNILESLQNIYNKITSLFEKRTGVEWLIPSYIMRLIFLTLFFTILLKK